MRIQLHDSNQMGKVSGTPLQGLAQVAGTQCAGRLFSADFFLKCSLCVRPQFSNSCQALFTNLSPVSHQELFSTSAFILGVNTSNNILQKLWWHLPNILLATVYYQRIGTMSASCVQSLQCPAWCYGLTGLCILGPMKLCMSLLLSATLAIFFILCPPFYSYTRFLSIFQKCQVGIHQESWNIYPPQIRETAVCLIQRGWLYSSPADCCQIGM